MSQCGQQSSVPCSCRTLHDHSDIRTLVRLLAERNVNWWKKTLRISNEFIRDIGAMVQPGDSAVFMFLRTPNIVSVLKQLRNYGGTLLHFSLSQEQEETLKNALAFRK